MTTKDRTGAGLAAVAAIIGLVLVFGYRDASAAGSDDDGAGPADPAPTSQVAPGPAPGGQVSPPPGQIQQPAEPQQDDDG